MPQKSLRVKSRFEASENISATARKIEKNTRRLNKSMKRGFRESSRSALKFKGVLKGILAASVIQKGFGLLSQGVSAVTSEFIGFEDAITGAAVKFKDLNIDSADFDKQLKKIGKSARETAASTLFTPEQAAQGMLFMAKAGFTSAEAMKGLSSMIFLATSTGEEFMQVADQSSDLLGAFGLSAENTEQKIKNLNRLNDVLAITTSSANVNVNDMFETMKQIGPIASGILGASLEEVAALTAVLGNSGIKGSEAMTALKNAYLRLAAATGPGAAVMKIFNLTLKDGRGGVKKMTDLLEELTTSAQFGALDPVDQAGVLDAIFGKRAIAGSKGLMNNIQAIREYEKRALNATGISKKMAEVMQKTLGGRIKILGSTLTELSFKVMEPFEKQIKNNITALTDFSKTANPQPLVDAFTAISDAASLVFKLLGKLKTTTKTGEKGEATKAFDRFIKSFVTPGGPSPFAGEAKFLSDLIPSLFETESIQKQNEAILNAVKGFFTPGPGAQAGIREHFRNPFADTQPELATPQQPNLNVNVQNNIKGNNVEVESEVEVPKSSGGQGRNKF